MNKQPPRRKHQTATQRPISGPSRMRIRTCRDRSVGRVARGVRCVSGLSRGYRPVLGYPGGDNSLVGPLSDLDGVPWASLHGTHGPADRIPAHLAALRSPDPTVAGEALTRLRDAVVHQGTRWQVSAHVVRFLVLLINDPGTPARPALTRLLRDVGLGAYTDHDLPFGPKAAFDGPAVTRRQEDMVIALVYYRDEGFTEEAMDIADSCAAKWAADAYRAVAAHVDAYRHWLGDDPLVASQAAELLAWFPADEPTIAALLSADGDDAVRASANLALAHLPVSPCAIAARMTDLLGHDSFVVRVTAAVALARRLGQELPDPALSLLIDAKDAAALPDFPLGWQHRAARGYVASALQRLGLG
ncbi:hypothetical protein ENC19_06775 [Verrucosispora sp. CWR15]|uniref:HEAT repeat domain-containing protein n=1 Tax=Verrucosispora sioxanthis TaxID=2499994 RepID=A0A6M1L203_9ACTN|nr:hypothetical protein [Verrucosispora sioxanthis]NEE63281.1 hypothetical protein [Verrucosispora sioxanthis]NGM12391.1 hypothetical protein [Verrucosispora sioxanthis]